jgi:hypothetical protein
MQERSATGAADKIPGALLEPAVTDGSKTIIFPASSALIVVFRLFPCGGGGVDVTPFRRVAKTLHQGSPERPVGCEVFPGSSAPPDFQGMYNRVGIFVGDRRKKMLRPHRTDDG